MKKPVTKKTTEQLHDEMQECCERLRYGGFEYDRHVIANNIFGPKKPPKKAASKKGNNS